MLMLSSKAADNWNQFQGRTEVGNNFAEIRLTFNRFTIFIYFIPAFFRLLGSFM